GGEEGGVGRWGVWGVCPGLVAPTEPLKSSAFSRDSTAATASLNTCGTCPASTAMCVARSATRRSRHCVIGIARTCRRLDPAPSAVTLLPSPACGCGENLRRILVFFADDTRQSIRVAHDKTQSFPCPPLRHGACGRIGRTDAAAFRRNPEAACRGRRKGVDRPCARPPGGGGRRDGGGECSLSCRPGRTAPCWAAGARDRDLGRTRPVARHRWRRRQGAPCPRPGAVLSPQLRRHLDRRGETQPPASCRDF